MQEELLVIQLFYRGETEGVWETPPKKVKVLYVESHIESSMSPE